MIDAEEGTLRGIVHGTVAAGFGEANIFDGAVAINTEGHGGFGATSGANAGIDGVLHPVLANGADHGLHVPGIAPGKITALSLHADPTVAVEGTRRSRVTGGKVRGAALAGDGVGGVGRLLFENLGFFAGRKWPFLGEFGNLGGI